MLTYEPINAEENARRRQNLVNSMPLVGYSKELDTGYATSGFLGGEVAQELGISKPEGQGLVTEAVQAFGTGLGRMGAGIAATAAEVIGDQATAQEIRRSREKALEDRPWLKPVDYGSVWNNVTSGSWLGQTIGGAVADYLPSLAGGIGIGMAGRGMAMKFGASARTFKNAEIAFKAATAETKVAASAEMLAARAKVIGDATRAQKLGVTIGNQVAGFTTNYGDTILDLQEEAKRNGVEMSNSTAHILSFFKTLIDNFVETGFSSHETDIAGSIAGRAVARRMGADAGAKEVIEAASKSYLFGKFYGSGTWLGRTLKQAGGEAVEEGIQYINEEAFKAFGAGKHIDFTTAIPDMVQAMAGGLVGGFGLGGVSEAFRVRAEIKAAALSAPVNDATMKKLADKGVFTDQASLQQTNQYFDSFMATLPQGYNRVGEIIKNISFNMAAETGVRPEAYIKNLSTVFLDQTALPPQKLDQFNKDLDAAAKKSPYHVYEVLNNYLPKWKDEIKGVQDQFHLDGIRRDNEARDAEIAKRNPPVIDPQTDNGKTWLSGFKSALANFLGGNVAAIRSQQMFTVDRAAVVDAFQKSGKGSMLRDLYIHGGVNGVELSAGNVKGTYDIRMTNSGISFIPSSKAQADTEARIEKVAAAEQKAGVKSKDIAIEIAKERIRAKKQGALLGRMDDVGDFFNSFLAPRPVDVKAEAAAEAEIIDRLAQKTADPAYEMTEQELRDYARFADQINSRKEVIRAENNRAALNEFKTAVLAAIQQANAVKEANAAAEAQKGQNVVGRLVKKAKVVFDKTADVFRGQRIEPTEADKAAMSPADLAFIDHINEQIKTGNFNRQQMAEQMNAWLTSKDAANERQQYQDRLDAMMAMRQQPGEVGIPTMGVGAMQTVAQTAADAIQIKSDIDSRRSTLLKNERESIDIYGETSKEVQQARQELAAFDSKYAGWVGQAGPALAERNFADGNRSATGYVKKGDVFVYDPKAEQQMKMQQGERPLEGVLMGQKPQRSTRQKKQRGGPDVATSIRAFYDPNQKMAVFLASADAGSVLHEFMHHTFTEHLLPDSVYMAFKKAYGRDEENRTYDELKRAKPELSEPQLMQALLWNTPAEENMANSMIVYIRDNTLPEGASEELASAFEHLKKQFKRTYGRLKETRFKVGAATQIMQPLRTAPAATTTTPAAAPAGTSPAATTTAATTPAAQALKIPAGKYATGVTFTTERGGSVYTVLNDGTTIRVKGASLGHTDAGEKPASTRTVYVDEKTVNIIDGIYAQGLEKFNDFTIAEDGTITYNYWHGRDKSGNLIGHTAILKSQASPAVGLYPVELLPNNGKHIGTAIANINQAAPISAQMAQPSVSPEQDARYMELAKDPEANKEELQRMVDEAAKRAGYNVGPVYHGTSKRKTEHRAPGEPFPPVKLDKSIEPGVFVTRNITLAQTYSGEVYPSNIKEFASGIVSPSTVTKNEYPPEGAFTMTLYARVNNPIVVNSIKERHALGGLDKIINQGYDAIEVKDAELVLIDPSQIKSADPITRDDAGNIIPLSQRFQASTQDIRFQAAEAVVTGPYEYSSKPLALSPDVEMQLDAMFAPVDESDLATIYGNQAADSIDDSRMAHGTAPLQAQKEFKDAVDIVFQKDPNLSRVFGEAGKAARVVNMSKEDIVKMVAMAEFGEPSVSNLTPEQMVRLARKLRGMYAGKNVTKTTAAVNEAEAKAISDEVIQNMDAAPRTWKEQAKVAGSSANLIAIKNTIKWLGRQVATFISGRTDFLNFLEDNPDGPIHRFVGEWLYQGDAVKYTVARKFRNRFAEIADEEGGYPSNLDDEVNVGGIMRPLAQVISMYTWAQGGAAGWQNRYEVQQLLEANDVSIKEVEDAIKIVQGNKQLQNMSRGIQRFFAEVYAELNPVALAVTGEEMKKINGMYATMIRQGGLIHDGDWISLLEGMSGTTFRRSSDIEKYRLAPQKSRDIAGGGRKGVIEMDIRKIIDRYYSQAANYIGAAPALKKVMAVMNNQPVADAMRRRFGTDEVYTRMMELFKRDLSVTGRTEPSVFGEQFMEKLTRNAYTAFMSGNPWSVANQMLSFPAAFAYLNSRDIALATRTLGSLMKTVMTRKNLDLNDPVIALIAKEAPHILERYPDQSIEEWTKESATKVAGVKLGKENMIRKAIELGNVPMVRTDMAITMSIWYTAYVSKMTESKNNGLSPEVASRIARNWANQVVIRTNNPSVYSERGLAQTKGGMFRMLTPFSGQAFAAFKANLAMIYPLIKGYEAGGWAGFAKSLGKESIKPANWKKMAFYNVLPAFLFMVLSKRGELPDKDELTKAMVLYPLMSVPVLGPLMWGAATQGFVSGDNTIIGGMLRDVTRTVKDVVDSPEKGFGTEELGRAMRGAAKITGLPNYPLKIAQIMIDSAAKNSPSLPDTNLSGKVTDRGLLWLSGMVGDVARELQ